ncbi:crooked neck-like protein 1 isoform X2 [Brassica napus]|uniref:crooked neck-like protein 1 isoform X2 n=1 Tax=Brassica napus TaxID=3708 RepID=UPI00207884CA|nr:crooked neck-like protein 1 isoform X2 [Brassica napus]
MYKRATKKLAEAETLLVAFTEFEERFKESERARFIYKFGLDHIPTWRAEDLYKKFVAFEKQYGDKEETEDATAGKRRFQYEDEVRKNTLNYDSWFDYVTLIILRIRRINYALYGDIETKDVERTQDVYMYTKAYLF